LKKTQAMAKGNSRGVNAKQKERKQLKDNNEKKTATTREMMVQDSHG